ncbi:hypothetical protein [Pseudomonas sichuanensis]|uniref:hypothetical protein n=1 Tax=Pseudomonas sichuanensis TaxID=2213015 RepID=UPI000DA661C7|nr:hypothetical protein [Pseudomonas sichuanensis]
MSSYRKPEIYTDADWDMVQGYMRGSSGLPMERSTAAYKHGWMNGRDDRSGMPRERANVLIRRANMIPGITPMNEIGVAS